MFPNQTITNPLWLMSKHAGTMDISPLNNLTRTVIQISNSFKPWLNPCT